MKIQIKKNQPAQSDYYLSLAEAAKSRKVSQDYLRFLIFKKKLHAVKFGRNWVTKAAWLDEYFSQVKKRGSTPAPTIQDANIISSVVPSHPPDSIDTIPRSEFSSFLVSPLPDYIPDKKYQNNLNRFSWHLLYKNIFPNPHQQELIVLVD